MRFHYKKFGVEIISKSTLCFTFSTSSQQLIVSYYFLLYIPNIIQF